MTNDEYLSRMIAGSNYMKMGRKGTVEERRDAMLGLSATFIPIITVVKNRKTNNFALALGSILFIGLVSYTLLAIAIK